MLPRRLNWQHFHVHPKWDTKNVGLGRSNVGLVNNIEKCHLIQSVFPFRGTIWLWLTVRHGKIHHAIKFGKPSISISAIYTMAMLVITRGYPIHIPFIYHIKSHLNPIVHHYKITIYIWAIYTMAMLSPINIPLNHYKIPLNHYKSL